MADIRWLDPVHDNRSGWERFASGFIEGVIVGLGIAVLFVRLGVD